MPTILLVDDDEGVRRVIKDHLASLGYDVLAAPDTIAASLQLTSHSQIDLFLVDLVMPPDVPDGVAFAQSMRRQRPGIPVILITGYYSAAERAGELADRLVYKPVSLDSLATEIHRLLIH